MVGSSASIAGPNFVLNAAVADILEEVADRLEAAEDKEGEAKENRCGIYQKHKGSSSMETIIPRSGLRRLKEGAYRI